MGVSVCVWHTNFGLILAIMCLARLSWENGGQFWEVFLRRQVQLATHGNLVPVIMGKGGFVSGLWNGGKQTHG